MAGHSKWANIKHKKERADKKKGKIFSRIIKELTTAVKEGGANPETNPKLRMIMQKAKAANIPNENIERNIQKATSSDSQNYESVTYEIYGQGGVGILVEALTDNKNRTASDMRIATNKCGGSIASPGSVAYNFDKKGIIQVPKEGISEDELLLIVSDLGADDLEEEEGIFYITTPPQELIAIKEGLEEKEISCSEAQLAMIPKTLVECSKENQESNQKLIDWLENIDDVDEVFHNMRTS